MIRIGIVGCGRILAAHLRGYRLLRKAGVDNFRITALCARHIDDARMYVKRGAGPPQRPAVSTIAGDPLAVGDEYLSDFQDVSDVQLFTDYERMIAEAPLDAVNDFTTHALHHQVARIAFLHQKHLLTQKPLAVTVEAARRMCEEAEGRDLVLGVFENFRHAPVTRQLAWLFGSSWGGPLQMALTTYVGLWWAPNRIVAETPWRHRLIDAGGISLDLGVHFFDQLRYVAGEISHVTARTAVLERERVTLDAAGQVRERIACDADDTMMAQVETVQGAIAQLTTSWAGVAAASVLEQGTVWYGARARATGDEVQLADDHTAQSLALLYAGEAPAGDRQRLFPLGLADSFALSQLDWLEAIRNRRPPETDGREGMRDLAAAYAILESHVAGRRVAVDEVLKGELADYQRPINRHFGLLD